MKNKLKALFDTKTTHGKIARMTVFVLVLGLICLLGYFILKWTGLWEKVNSIDKIRDVVMKGGMFSFIIFILLQILQTTVLQIPAVFVTIAGAAIFGIWPAFIMSYISIMIGSIIMFWIGRKAGRKFLNWIVGKSESEKWIDRMSGGKYLYFLMMVFPMFPDDILCVIAGLTNMSFTFFFWTNILARGLGVACTVFLGSGEIIPYRGWGLVVWGVLIAIVIVLFFLSVKYKTKIDEILNRFFKKHKPNPECATSEAREETALADTNPTNIIETTQNDETKTENPPTEIIKETPLSENSTEKDEKT